MSNREKARRAERGESGARGTGDGEVGVLLCYFADAEGAEGVPAVESARLSEK